MYFSRGRLRAGTSACCVSPLHQDPATNRHGGKETAMNIDRRQVSEFERQYLDNLTKISVESGTIEPALYQKYNVKRGLRNADGTGVLVGLTSIGDVHGYIVDENEKVSVKGRLRYRGIDIEEIVRGFQAEARHGFHEVVYLLLFGRLPTRIELGHFNDMLDTCRDLPEGFTEDIDSCSPQPGYHEQAGPGHSSSYSYDADPDDTGIRNVLRQCIELIARFPTMVAYGYQAKRHYYDNKSLYLHKPQPGLSTAENFLYMVRPDSSYTALEAEILDLALVLHAEHGGGNNSAFAIHVVTSSDTDTYSAVAAAVGSLKGTKHGRANIKVAKMFEDIQANVKDWQDEDWKSSRYLTKIVRKEAFDRSGLIYGIGHAVYTLSDPRAVILAVGEELACEGTDRSSVSSTGPCGGAHRGHCKIKDRPSRRRPTSIFIPGSFTACSIFPASSYAEFCHLANCRVVGAPDRGNSFRRKDHPPGV